MNKELPKAYSPKETEDSIYKFWQDNGYFHAEANKNKTPYTIMLPPPNITGQLHMGHALDQTLQDILIRFKRMNGFEALWLPGTDHASIATEAKIVEAMKKEGISKEDIGREEFLKRAWKWKEKYGSKIIEQLKKLGSSCDWERERFTLDDGCSEAVKKVFVNLYNKGLIYRGERIINWCPKCKTSISDAEVEFNEKDGAFYHIKYKISMEDTYLTLATTRPETLLGDTAVAVHPDDERYKHLIGKKVILPIVNKEIPIIADTYVEKDFGTGVVKITPAHDPNDFEVGLRHNLPIINVMDENANMNENAGEYKGLSRYQARERIVNKLKEENLLVKIEPIKHNVGTCYRCHETVEPRISKQWFVKMKPLAEPALLSVKNKNVKFVPERFEKTYNHWMENIKDWCISRQLWWGHRIPAYYCLDCKEIMVSEKEINTCTKCGSNNINQDEDTLDTWFSSALWPFSTLGWPNDTEELKYFYPTNTLVTGYDIIFFWVARMIFSGIEHTGKAPFDTVFIHGIVRDEKGRKMSKSLGNGVDPLIVIEKYGADALRFALATGVTPGNDMRFSTEKVESSRNFANKIWNASRFIHMNIDGKDINNELPKNLSLEDKWIISAFNTTAKEVNDNIEKLELGIAVHKLYGFIWDKFCDWYIELAKVRLKNDDASAKNAREVLVWVLKNTLKLLHPFMPFITEKIFRSLPVNEESIMVSKYPAFNKNLCFANEEAQMEKIMELIRAIRNRRAEMNVPKTKKASIYIDTDNKKAFLNGTEFIKKLAYASEVNFCENAYDGACVTIITGSAKVYIPTDELVNKEEEIARLNKELEAVNKEIEFVNAKINNESFLKKAPQNVVNNVKESKKNLAEKLLLIETAIKSIK